MENRVLTATALVTRNSSSYLHAVFALNEARQPFVNVSDEAHAKSLTGLTVDRCIVPEDGAGWFTEHYPLIHDDAPAQVTYTSGTEGKPKGIVLTYANLADAAERIIAQMRLTKDIREYVGVPVTFSFGIGRIRAISAVGGQSYLPSRGFDPHELARMLMAGEVNALSAVPTLLRLLLQSPNVIGDAGRNLRWLEIGSQYMSAAEKRGIRTMFPEARIVQHYGLTEASRSTFLTISEAAEEQLESVGQPVGATEIGLSEDGRICIRGPHVARWRIGDNELVDLRDSDGWLQTSDLGHMENGYLFYDGRADDLINVGGVKVNPDLLEARIAKALYLGGRVVAAKVPDPLRGDGILVVTEATDLAESRLRQASLDALKALGVQAGDALHIRFVPSIPRTTTGKPLRRVLATQFLEEQAAAPVSPVMARTEGESTSVLGFFREFFPNREIGQDDSFERIGGDSLNYIQFSMDFENRFGTLPSGWDRLTVAQLEHSVATKGNRKSSWRLLESATLTRAFFMICIVALHLDTFVYSKTWGAAYFLFMLCGYSVMRFQWPEIRRTGKVNAIFGTVIRVAIPTILVVIVMQLLARTFELKPLLLISNWFDPSEYQVVYYYFAEIYMQLLLILALLLSIPKVREILSNQPILACIALIVVSMGVSWIMDQLWDTNYLYHRTPVWYLWTVGAGMLMACAKTLRGRILAMAVVSVVVYMHHGYSTATAYILGGSALLLFWPEIMVPSAVKTVVAEIASSSMFMYLSHYQIRSLIVRIFHGQLPWLALFAAIGFGIVSSHVYMWLETRVRNFLAAHRRTSQRPETAP